MVIAFIINELAKEVDSYTTVHLAYHAYRLGHEPLFLEVGKLSYDPDGQMGGTAYGPPKKTFKTVATFMDAVRKSAPRHITATDIEVLMLRNDPSDDLVTRPWAVGAGIIFGQLAARNGVLVLNDPFGLAGATSKLYFQHFPALVRPRTLITRDLDQIKTFFAEQDEQIILKPLQGSGGRNVFKVNDQNLGNLRQIVDAIGRDGYVIAQEYLPDAVQGDIRLFVMNGSALQRDGHYAAFRRVTAKGDVRSNIKAGGTPAAVKVTPAMRHLVEAVRPKLLTDGMFLAGLDIVGDKLMEINVFSPGGLHNISKLEGVDFFEPVIEAIDRKLWYKKLYGEKVTNEELAVR
ncbi:MAG: glutathione synthase [Flavobacteriales bacterium]|nr:glutathione synthase [Flavobacteriales bacterium]